jgi:ribonuclease BN (tRNA processing enzyme)
MGAMDLIPLGCLAGMPSDGVASSGYLVMHDDSTIMLDAGPGTAVALSKQLGARRLSAVFVSHQHSDHILDLLAVGKMILGTRLRRDPATGAAVLDESTPRVPLFVPEGALAVLQQFAALFPVTTHPLLDRSFDLAFDVHEYEPGERLALGDLSLRFELLKHTAPNCGIRIEAADASLVYTGDTGVTDALPSLATGAGTLLSESTLRETDTSAHGHLSSQDAGRAAADAGVAELILTHFASTDRAEQEWHRERAAAVFSGPVDLARPDHRFPIAPTRKVLV